MSVEELIQEAVSEAVSPLVAEIKALRNAIDTNQKKMLTTKEVKEQYGIGYELLKRLRRQYRINYVPGKRGRADRYPRHELEQALTQEGHFINQ